MVEILKSIENIKNFKSVSFEKSLICWIISFRKHPVCISENDFSWDAELKVQRGCFPNKFLKRLVWNLCTIAGPCINKAPATKQNVFLWIECSTVKCCPLLGILDKKIYSPDEIRHYFDFISSSFTFCSNWYFNFWIRSTWCLINCGICCFDVFHFLVKYIKNCKLGSQFFVDNTLLIVIFIH